jgi:hypothetical protein
MNNFHVQNGIYQPRLVAAGHLDADEYLARMDKLQKLVLTIKEATSLCGFNHISTIQRAIDTGRLIAVKKDAAHGKRGGVWIIETQSLEDEFGDRLHFNGYGK